eukprot:CAMPEP_0180440892 /NCGR_PEP_ID=MMETSP1036_2-20121128/13343_1 /TAXON_ID=632150 /ORGANISM="Azadinium spinosum, Strain 3D9" /LENGTH=252 /DNA_ID=CAMNT_0022447087 /DNA_START=24 /DNA_END=782 /DNA_ORIENTATION=-
MTPKAQISAAPSWKGTSAASKQAMRSFFSMQPLVSTSFSLAREVSFPSVCPSKRAGSCMPSCSPPACSCSGAMQSTIPAGAVLRRSARGPGVPAQVRAHRQPRILLVASRPTRPMTPPARLPCAIVQRLLDRPAMLAGVRFGEPEDQVQGHIQRRNPVLHRFFKQPGLRSEVAMYDIMFVQVVDGAGHLHHQNRDAALIEAVRLGAEAQEVSTAAEVREQVHTRRVLLVELADMPVIQPSYCLHIAEKGVAS